MGAKKLVGKLVVGTTELKEKEIADDVDGKPLGNIHQRVNKIMGEINYIKKDKSIDF